MVGLPGVSLIFDISLLSQMGVQLQHGSLKPHDRLLTLAQAHLEAVDLQLVLATHLFSE